MRIGAQAQPTSRRIVMDRYLSRSDRGPTSYQDQFWNTISDYRYLAPVKMAMDESHDRLLAEAACARVLLLTDPAIGPRQLIDNVRYRLGQHFIRLGTLLCGAPQPIPSA